MKKIQSNLHYFNISRQNLENFLDNFYIFDEKHPQLQEYIVNAKEVKNILITIKTLQEKKESKEVVEKYFLELSKILNKFSNCSEFGCFINACDSFLNFAKKNIILLEKIAQRYFEKRIFNETIPEEWVQAILDSNSSRKKGKCGEKKLLNILAECGFQEVKTWEGFFNEQKCVAKFSKIFSVKNVRKNLNIKMAAKKQNKKLDLIKIISLKEQNNNISYVAFLDGSYSNILLGEAIGGEKLTTQRKEIEKCLLRNSYNFWVNTAGFEALFADLKE